MYCGFAAVAVGHKFPVPRSPNSLSCGAVNLNGIEHLLGCHTIDLRPLPGKLCMNFEGSPDTVHKARCHHCKADSPPKHFSDCAGAPIISFLEKRDLFTVSARCFRVNHYAN